MTEPDWDRIAFTGNCDLCGRRCYGQNICDACDRKQVEEEESKNWCPNCEDAIVELEDQICEVCIEMAHDDNKCFDNCPICSNERDRERGER